VILVLSRSDQVVLIAHITLIVWQVVICSQFARNMLAREEKEVQVTIV